MNNYDLVPIIRLTHCNYIATDEIEFESMEYGNSYIINNKLYHYKQYFSEEVFFEGDYGLQNIIGKNIVIPISNSSLKERCKGQKIYKTIVIEKEKIQPRAIKLEDLNKSWLHLGLHCVDRILSIKQNGSICVVKGDDSGSATFKDSDSFFSHYREATQADIDNLMKGE